MYWLQILVNFWLIVTRFNGNVDVYWNGGIGHIFTKWRGSQMIVNKKLIQYSEKKIILRKIKPIPFFCPLRIPPCPNKTSKFSLNLVTSRQNPFQFCYPTSGIMPLNIFMAIWINFKNIFNTLFSIFRLLVWPNQVEFKSPLPKTLGLWEQRWVKNEKINELSSFL